MINAGVGVHPNHTVTVGGRRLLGGGSLGAAVLGAGAGAGAGVEVELEAGVVAAEVEELFAGAAGAAVFVVAALDWVAPLESEVEELAGAWA